MVAVTKTSTSAQSEQSRFAERVRQIAPAPINIIQFRMDDHLLSFRLGQPLETLVEWQDLHHKITSDNRQRYIYIIMPKDYVYPAIQILSDIKWKILSQSEIINNKIYILLSANQ